MKSLLVYVYTQNVNNKRETHKLMIEIFDQPTNLPLPFIFPPVKDNIILLVYKTQLILHQSNKVLTSHRLPPAL